MSCHLLLRVGLILYRKSKCDQINREIISIDFFEGGFKMIKALLKSFKQQATVSHISFYSPIICRPGTIPSHENKVHAPFLFTCVQYTSKNLFKQICLTSYSL